MFYSQLRQLRSNDLSGLEGKQLYMFIENTSKVIAAAGNKVTRKLFISNLISRYISSSLELDIALLAV